MQKTHPSTPQWLLLICSLLGLCVLLWFMLDHLLINRDVSWLLQITGRLIDGGNYVHEGHNNIHNFFEVDPPAILYVYSPIVLISRLLSLPLIPTFQCSVFFLACLSLGINYYLLKKIGPVDNSYIEDRRPATCSRDPEILLNAQHYCTEMDRSGSREQAEGRRDLNCQQNLVTHNLFLFHAFFLSMVVVFFIFPVYEFGQKEHLLIMLSMPYLLLLAIRCRESHHNVPGFLVAVIGVMAGTVFCLKPHFLIIPLLLELYYLYCKKNPFAWVRVETMIILTFLLVYGMVIFARHMDYLTSIVPFLLRYLYPIIASHLSVLLCEPISIFCYFSLLFFIIQYHALHHPKFATLLALTLVGAFASFLMQRTDWYYHELPSASFASLLFMLVLNDSDFSSKRTRLKSTVYEIYFLLFVGSLTYAVGIPVGIIIFFPLVTYVFFYWIVGCVIRHQMLYRHYYRIFSSLILSSLLTYLVHLVFVRVASDFSLTLGIPFEITQFITSYCYIAFALLSLGLLFCDLHHRPLLSKPVNIVFVFAVVSCLLAQVFMTYIVFIAYNKRHAPMITFINQHADHKRIYFLSTGIEMYPYVDYTTGILESRFSQLILLGGILTLGNKHDLDFFNHLVIDDIKRLQPHLIFINEKDYGFSKDSKLSHRIDYLKHFSQDPTFHTLWKKYHYLTQVSAHNFMAVKCHVGISSTTPVGANHLKGAKLWLIKSHNKWLITTLEDKTHSKPTKISEVPDLTQALASVATKKPEELSQNERASLEKPLMTFCQDSQLLYKFSVYQRNDGA